MSEGSKTGGVNPELLSQKTESPLGYLIRQYPGKKIHLAEFNDVLDLDTNTMVIEDKAFFRDYEPHFLKDTLAEEYSSTRTLPIENDAISCGWFSNHDQGAFWVVYWRDKDGKLIVSPHYRPGGERYSKKDKYINPPYSEADREKNKIELTQFLDYFDSIIKRPNGPLPKFDYLKGFSNPKFSYFLKNRFPDLAVLEKIGEDRKPGAQYSLDWESFLRQDVL